MPMTPLSSILPAQADHAFEELFDLNYQARHAADAPYWLGDAAPILGLNSLVTPEPFRNLLKGLRPDGKASIFKTPNPSRPCAWHWTHTAPGSVSVLWALGSPAIRQLASDAHRDGVDVNLVCESANLTGYPDYLDFEKTSHFLFACFPACASHAQTPQLHTQIVWINAAFRPDGIAEAISQHSVNDLASCRDGYFYNLAMHFRVNFGEFRVRDFGWPNYQIIGVPRELYADPVQGSLAQNDPLQRPILCAHGKASSREQLLQCWQAQALAFGWAAHELNTLTRTIRAERACLRKPDQPRSVPGVAEYRQRTEAKTDRLLLQAIARNNAKRALMNRPSSLRTAGGDQPIQTGLTPVTTASATKPLDHPHQAASPSHEASRSTQKKHSPSNRIRMRP